MAQKDKERWDEKHMADTMPHEPIKFIREYAHLANGTQALDIACGNGRHSKYLVSLGYAVDALDISSVAISSLRDVEGVEAVEVDFDTHVLDKNKYDLVVCTYFLERRLFPQMIESLKPHGIVLMETFVQHANNGRKATNPTFRLKEGELKAYFEKECELLYIQEWWDKDYQGFDTLKVSMAAKRK